MSTRAVYTFKDSYNTFAIYKHHDGYPSGAVEWLNAAFGKSWSKHEGRFEADELSAAFVAANKQGAGAVYLSKGQHRHGDLSYDYVVKNNKKGGIIVDAYEHRWVDGDKKRVRIFTGTFGEFTQKYAEAA